MNLFIDTNIFLSFYHLTNDDIRQLEKLEELLRDEKIVLFTPEQVIDEFWRNREVKIADAIKRMKEQKLDHSFPQICKDYSEDYAAMREALEQCKNASKNLIDKITADTESRSLQADGLIARLFDLAKKTETDRVFEKARRRFDIGSPPRKPNNADSLGDAINWEAILADVPNGEDLHLITGDRDYMSPMDDKRIHEFLIREWTKKKQSHLQHYPQLSDYLKKNAPQIKLATEMKKDHYIAQLAKSGSFAMTHSVIGRLSNFTEFSPSQLDSILDATISNRQVGWVASDEDMRSFLSRALEGHESEVDPAKLSQVQELMELPDEASGEDGPDFSVCDICEPGEDQMPGTIDWLWSIDTESEDFVTGHCGRCSGITVFDRHCKAETPVEESHYNIPLECNGGCGRWFKIRHEWGRPGDEPIDVLIELHPEETIDLTCDHCETSITELTKAEVWQGQGASYTCPSCERDTEVPEMDD